MTPRARLRLTCALGAALVAVALAGAPAFASTPAPSPSPTPTPTPTAAPDVLTPLVDCVQDAPLGAVTSRTVVLGYRSSATSPVTVTPGSGADDLSPGTPDRGQPSTFLPGEHHGVWLLTVDAAAEPSLTWTLGGRSATIDATAPACTDATAIVLSTPATATSSGTVAVSATVTRFLLAAPDTGTVAFAVDGGSSTTVPVGPGGIARTDLPAPAAGAHTVTATFAPAAGSTLRPATTAAPLTVAAASGALAVAADSVVSGSTSVTVHVTRTGASAPVTVDFATVDGTAHAGTDYVAASGALALAAGQAAATATVSLPARAPGSPASVFFVVLQRATADVSGAVAMVSLPAVPVAAPASAAVGGAGGGGAADAASALPQGDPTAHTPLGAAPVGQDLLLLLGAALVAVGGVAGIIGLFRSVRPRDGLL
ncbi:Calx-beta domain-containing protein [Leifsonia sp. EB34]|uniref:Calx-beta domain-containing protein n=1 Tax=Leifsonia sp. EB34 TaxID=3156303 RepID=UPI0035141CE4